MKKLLLVVIAAALIACISPDESGVKVIVGAKLVNPGAAPIEYSVVVVQNGKFTNVGPQASTPVPKGAELLRGIGMTIQPVPGGPPIEPGERADLVLKGPTDRVMRAGEWVR